MPSPVREAWNLKLTKFVLWKGYIRLPVRYDFIRLVHLLKGQVDRAGQVRLLAVLRPQRSTSTNSSSRSIFSLSSSRVIVSKKVSFPCSVFQSLSVTLAGGLPRPALRNREQCLQVVRALVLYAVDKERRRPPSPASQAALQVLPHP